MRTGLLRLLVADVEAWCGSELLVLVVAQYRRRLDLAARALRDPVRPSLPPAARFAFGAVQPGFRVGPGCTADPVVRLGVTGRIDQAGDVPGVTEHKRALAAEQLGGPIAIRPGGEVVGDRTGHEGRGGDE